MAAVRGIGLSGQMLGVTLARRRRHADPAALLWNDGRASAECAELQSLFRRFRRHRGLSRHAGFLGAQTAVAEAARTDAMARTRRILLTKDYIRLRLVGEAVSDRADASATLLMDTARGDWHDGILAACGVDRARLPRLVESGEISGALRGELASRWRLPAGTPVAGGGGDNMCAGCRRGARCRPGRPTSAWERRASTSSPTTGSCRPQRRHAYPSPRRAGTLCPTCRRFERRRALAWVAGLLGRRTSAN